MKHKEKTQHAICTIQEELIFCAMVGNWWGGGTSLILKVTHSTPDGDMMIM